MKGNPFIRRPMAAFAISILIVIVGVISLLSLPIEQYPDIAPPTVMVSTSYPGADADAVMDSAYTSGISTAQANPPAKRE